MSRDVVQDHLALAQLAELSARMLAQTETIERLVSGIRNHVLFAGTITIPAEGWWSMGWGAPCGSVEITNHSTANALVVAASWPSGVAPDNGPGVHKIPAKIFRILNIDAPVITVYGTAGDEVGVQAFTTGGIAGQGVSAV